MYELDKVITDAEKEELVDTIIIKTQGFVNGNIKNGDKNPVDTFHHLLAPYKGIDRDALRENYVISFKLLCPYVMNMASICVFIPTILLFLFLVCHAL